MGYIPRTMLLSFMIVVCWSAVYIIVGLIILSSMPGLRVTLLNLIAFVFEGLLGSEIFSIVYGRYRGPFDNYPDAIGLVGAVAGGAFVVWLKMRFVKTPSDSRLL
jgi:hypothetical protein